MLIMNMKKLHNYNKIVYVAQLTLLVMFCVFVSV